VTLKVSDIPDTGEPKFEAAKKVPHLKTPAVWFPHTVMGISTSSILVDSTRGAFGPFAGQLFVGDQGHSKIMRVALEKVNGVYQGAVFAFREGFMSGVFRQAWGKDGSMFVGQTSRGWGATGRAQYGLQRLVWTGKTPFEAHHVSARPDGFEIFFTAPVDRATAGIRQLVGEQLHLQVPPHLRFAGDQRGHTPPCARRWCRRTGAVCGSRWGSLRQWYVHEIRMSGVRAAEGGAPLLHDVGYYTVNQIPAGKTLAVNGAMPARGGADRRGGKAPAPTRVPESNPPATGAPATVTAASSATTSSASPSRGTNGRALARASDDDARRMGREGRPDRERAGRGGAQVQPSRPST
jgi:hypothetical protein